jgi:hypothetical protein
LPLPKRPRLGVVIERPAFHFGLCQARPSFNSIA